MCSAFVELKESRRDAQPTELFACTKTHVNGVRRVLYRLPDVLKAKSVLVCEGEKDCEMARELGITATCSPGGAVKWRDEYSETLREKRVALIADADEPGRKHARQVAQSLHGKTESVKVLELPGAKDLSEWAGKGGTRDAFLELVRSAPEYLTESATLGPLLISVSIAELLEREIKPREMLLGPILPEQVWRCSTRTEASERRSLHLASRPR